MPKIRPRSALRSQVASGAASAALPSPSSRTIVAVQLDSSARIPDGLLAAMRHGGEKPHLGLPSGNPALYQGPTVCNSTTALGLQAAAVLNRVGSCSTGKERDAESGNDYFSARYYASSMGRFMSPDWSAKLMPVPYAKLDNPQTLNLYAYVGNNPLSRIDADGHYEISCGSGSKNCNQKELDRINKQIAKDQVSKNKARAAAAGAYGGLGEKNGVNISVVDQPDSKNANVNGTTGAQAGTPGFAYTPDGKATGVATAVTLKAGLDGGDLKDAIDHEGQHALDRQNYVNGLMQDATGESSKGLNITGRMSEVNAYTTQGLSPGEIMQQLSKPPYSTNPNIDKPLFPMPSAY